MRFLQKTVHNLIATAHVQKWLRETVQQLERRGKRFTDNFLFERLWMDRLSKVKRSLIRAIDRRLEKNPNLTTEELYKLLRREKRNVYPEGLKVCQVGDIVCVFFLMRGGLRQTIKRVIKIRN